MSSPTCEIKCAKGAPPLGTFDKFVTEEQPVEPPFSLLHARAHQCRSAVGRFGLDFM